MKFRARVASVGESGEKNKNTKHYAIIIRTQRCILLVVCFFVVLLKKGQGMNKVDISQLEISDEIEEVNVLLQLSYKALQFSFYGINLHVYCAFVSLFYRIYTLSHKRNLFIFSINRQKRTICYHVKFSHFQLHLLQIIATFQR